MLSDPLLAKGNIEHDLFSSMLQIKGFDFFNTIKVGVQIIWWSYNTSVWWWFCLSMHVLVCFPYIIPVENIFKLGVNGVIGNIQAKHTIAKTHPFITTDTRINIVLLNLYRSDRKQKLSFYHSDCSISSKQNSPYKNSSWLKRFLVVLNCVRALDFIQQYRCPVILTWTYLSFL